MNKKFYITTSIAYVNAEPHIGYAQELLMADVLARYHRNCSEQVFFSTGTDEHGVKVQKAAEEAGMQPEKFALQMSNKFRQLTRDLNISCDDFIQTTQPRHIKMTQEFWKLVAKTGDIYKKDYQGSYCVGCESFKAPSDLKDGKCIIHQTLVEKIKEENYFFKLSKYTDHILKHFKQNPDFVMPKSRYNEILRLLEQGLEDISISRPKDKLTWGIPIPDDESQLMYVWFDALVNYLTGISGGNLNNIINRKNKWWPADIHVIGKDILRFHAALWPGMLISAKIELPKQILIHGFIGVEGQKMSKSLGNVISPDQMIEKFGADSTRYLLLAGLDPLSDSDFSWKRMERLYNADLANNLGNLIQRTLVLANKIPEFKFKIKSEKSKVLDWRNPNAAIKEIMKEVTLANKIIDQEKPWKLVKNNQTKAKEVIEKLILSIITAAKDLNPVIPKVTEEIINQVKTGKPKPIFPKIKSK